MFKIFFLFFYTLLCIQLKYGLHIYRSVFITVTFINQLSILILGKTGNNASYLFHDKQL